MKKITVIAFVALFTSCGDNTTSEIKHVPATTQKEKKTPRFEGLVFASKIDTICEMPINPKTAEDTVLLNGKIYGFCAVECKQEFVNNLKEKKLR
jgi:YHS domain-containing protein